MSGINNISSLNIGKQLAMIEMQTQKKLQNLSTGQKINNAADDPAGLAIAVKMMGQTRGTQQAQRNIEDGISLTQIADGGLSQINDNLQRIRELSVQASNDTLTDANRQLIQEEITQLKGGINDIANNTNFNGIHPLNQGATGATTPATYEPTTSVIDLSQVQSVSFYERTMGAQPHKIDVTMAQLTQPGGYEWQPYAGSTEKYVFSADLSSNTITSKALYDPGNGINYPYNNISGVQLNGVEGYDQTQVWATSLVDDKTTPGGSAEWSLQQNNHSGGYGSVTYDTHITWEFEARKEITPASGSGGSENPFSQGLIIHTGPNSDQNLQVQLTDARTSNLGIDPTTVTTQNSANSAIAEIDEALKYVSNEQSKWGSYQNTLESTYYNRLNDEVNLTSSQSQIRDSITAQEMSEYLKNNLLLNVANSMLAHSFESNNRSVLSLLK